jgi:hypothetical protein
MEATQPAEVREFMDVYGGHGYLFTTGHGTVGLEHCHEGRWGWCDLSIDATASERETNRAAMRHLARKAHRPTHRAVLAGVTHAGDGLKCPR